MPTLDYEPRTPARQERGRPEWWRVVGVIMGVGWFLLMIYAWVGLSLDEPLIPMFGRENLKGLGVLLVIGVPGLALAYGAWKSPH